MNSLHPRFIRAVAGTSPGPRGAGEPRLAVPAARIARHGIASPLRSRIAGAIRWRPHRSTPNLQSMEIDQVDLEEIAQKLQRHIPPGEPPVGYLRGRSYFRDVLVHELRCSEMEAEQLVDTLEMNGYLHFSGDPSERSLADSRWKIVPHVP